MKRQIGVILTAVGIVIMTASGAMAGGHHKPAVCHPVNGEGETGYGWNIISPDKASSHIDEALYPTGHYWKHEAKDGRHDEYAISVSHQGWICPGAPTPSTSTTTTTVPPTETTTTWPTTQPPTSTTSTTPSSTSSTTSSTTSSSTTTAPPTSTTTSAPPSTSSTTSLPKPSTTSSEPSHSTSSSKRPTDDSTLAPVTSSTTPSPSDVPTELAYTGNETRKGVLLGATMFLTGCGLLIASARFRRGNHV